MTRGRRAGFTLLEMTIALVMLVMLLGGAALVLTRGQGVFRRSMSDSAIDTGANRALNSIARRLTGAGATTLFPVPVAPAWSDSIGFQEVVGWNAGAALWSTDTELRLEYEPGELDNDLDDDGDGFVDECQVLQVENAGQPDERRVVLLRNVREFLEGEEPDGVDQNGNGLEDERGLCFELRGDALIVRLSAMRRDPEGEVTIRTLETAVAMRN